MAKNYMFIGILTGIVILLLIIILYNSYTRYKTRPAQISLFLTKFISFLLISMLSYNIGIWLFIYDNNNTTYQLQLYSLIGVIVAQIIAHFYFFHFTNEVWGKANVKTNQIFQYTTILIIIIVIVISVLPFGNYEQANGKPDLIFPLYVLFTLYYIILEMRAIILGFLALIRLKNISDRNLDHLGENPDEISYYEQYWGMLAICIFFIMILLINVMVIIDLFSTSPWFFYISFLIAPLGCFIGYDGLFLPMFFRKFILKRYQK